jgi:hypothetical protein
MFNIIGVVKVESVAADVIFVKDEDLYLSILPYPYCWKNQRLLVYQTSCNQSKKTVEIAFFSNTRKKAGLIFRHELAALDPRKVIQNNDICEAINKFLIPPGIWYNDTKFNSIDELTLHLIGQYNKKSIVHSKDFYYIEGTAYSVRELEYLL